MTYNFRTAYTEAVDFYGITMDINKFYNIALRAWELIGNKKVHYERIFTATKDKKIPLPCGAEIESICDSTVSGSKKEVSQNIDILNVPGSFVQYHIHGEYVIFDRDYDNLAIIYKLPLADEDGFPYLNNKEVAAIACYVAYIEAFKMGKMTKNNADLQMAAVLKQDWQQLCSSARIPDYISQNDMDRILNVKTSWDRKFYGRSYKPIK